MAYDPKCWDLAAVFLSDHQHLDTLERIDQLAEIIQRAIDYYIGEELENYEPKETGDAWTGGFADNH